ncbi:MAG: hypothetical protein ABFS32_10670 [Bacteroidota bacterium]
MKKTLTVLAIFGALSILSSCLDKICEDKKYFDFNTMNIYIESTEILLNDSLSFHIRATDGYYLGFNMSNFSLFSSTYAFDCDEGWGGLKYPLTKIEITSDSDFNDNYPANSLLNGLVSIDAWIEETREIKNMKLDNVSISDNFESQMYISERPTISNEHTLTIKLYKSDGKVIESKTDKIIWN